MAKTFKRNNRGRLSWVAYQRPWFWPLSMTLMSCAILSLNVVLFGLKVLGLNIVQARKIVILLAFLFGFIAIVIVIYHCVKLFQSIRMAGGFADYLANKRAIKSVERGLLSAGLVKRTISEDCVDVPTCAIFEEDQRTILKIEKLPSVSDIEQVQLTVNSSLRKGKYAGYNAVESKMTRDSLYYVFELEDETTNLTFIPKSIDELVPKDKYSLKLQEGVYWHYPSQPMCLIAGQTGSRKTTTMKVLLAQMMAIGADIYIFDYKQEFYFFDQWLGAHRVSSEPLEILELSDDIVKRMRARQSAITRLAKRESKLGASGDQFNVRPIFIIAEELGALTTAFEDNKQRARFQGNLQKIAQMGRSSLCNLIVLAQVPDVNSVPSVIRNNLSLRILLGKSTSDMITQTFGNGYADQVTNNPGKSRGWYFLSGVTNQPKMFYVPDVFTHHLEGEETFAKLWEKGKNTRYRELD